MTRYYQIMQPLLDAGEKVAVMGDFNTLSSHDKRYRAVCSVV